jgi:protein TonB
MITIASKHSVPAPSGVSSALRGALLVTGMVLLLAGCGKGQQTPATTAPGSAPRATSAAPKASAPAALPAAAPAPASAASASNPAAQTALLAAKQAAAAKAKLASMSVSALLTAARDAYSQHRVVAPAGDNAMEYYEAVLAKDPNNQVAKDALRESFPFGVPDVESAISQSNFDEANREIDLLGKADPTNYTLTLLRSKLDAQKKLQARQQQQQQQQVAQQAAARVAAAAKAAQEAADAKAAAAAAEASRVAAASRPAPRPVAAAPKPASAASGESHGVKVIKAAAAQYPMQAARNQISGGYATVEFTVTAEGTVTNVHVVDSSPRRVFDRAAIDAVEHSKFAPAMKDGQAVSAVVERKIEFKL